MNDTLPSLITSALLLFAFAQGLFLVFLLLKIKAENKLGQYILVTLILCLVLNIGLEFIDVNYAPFRDANYIGVYLLMFSYSLAGGPLVYLYAGVITKTRPAKINKQFWLHLSPAILSFIVFLPFSTDTLPDIDNIPEDNMPGWAIPYSIGILFFLAQCPIYLLLSLRVIRKHRKVIKQIFSATEKINLDWLRNIVICIGIIYLLILSDFFVEEGSALMDVFDNYSTVFLVITVYALGYMGLRQTDIFSGLPNASLPPQNDETTNGLDTLITPTPKLTPQNPLDTTSTSPTASSLNSGEQGKYQNSSLTPETSQLLFEDLESYMNEHKPYLEHDLTLPKLAQYVQLSSNDLSQVINEQFKSHFFDYINLYRVKNVKTLLTVPTPMYKNMLDVAEASGFNSKSAFYKAFKLHTGMTPTEFKKNQIKSES